MVAHTWQSASHASVSPKPWPAAHSAAPPGDPPRPATVLRPSLVIGRSYTPDPDSSQCAFLLRMTRVYPSHAWFTALAFTKGSILRHDSQR